MRPCLGLAMALPSRRVFYTELAVCVADLALVLSDWRFMRRWPRDSVGGILSPAACVMQCGAQ
jgi:hypothetical protein